MHYGQLIKMTLATDVSGHKVWGNDDNYTFINQFVYCIANVMQYMPDQKSYILKQPKREFFINDSKIYTSFEIVTEKEIQEFKIKLLVEAQNQIEKNNLIIEDYKSSLQKERQKSNSIRSKIYKISHNIKSIEVAIELVKKEITNKDELYAKLKLFKDRLNDLESKRSQSSNRVFRLQADMGQAKRFIDDIKYLLSNSLEMIDIHNIGKGIEIYDESSRYENIS